MDEFVEHTDFLLHEQASEIRAKIERGYASAQRGELIDSGEVHAKLDEKKRVWVAEKCQG